jgi:hypothetical protein
MAATGCYPVIAHQTPYYPSLVGKRLACGTPVKIGYMEYRCLHCGQGKPVVALRCKSSLCLRCAKVAVDNWVSQVSRVLHEGVIYRHIILTVPAMFRTTFDQNAAVVWRAFRRCGAQCLDAFYSTIKGKALQGGSITVLHTHGRHGPYHPHLHVLATSGGYDGPGVGICPTRRPRPISSLTQTDRFVVRPALLVATFLYTHSCITGNIFLLLSFQALGTFYYWYYR